MMSTFTDQRDGEVYKTVKIGNQTWFAENLRYRGTIQKFNDWVVEEKNFCYFPNDNRILAKNYGCLYIWDNALKAVPAGWHLPTLEEFQALLSFVGSDTATQSANLRAESFAGGKDLYGFWALPAGYYSGYYYRFGQYANFWSSTEYEEDTNYAYIMYLGDGDAEVSYDCIDYGFSVRCIKD